MKSNIWVPGSAMIGAIVLIGGILAHPAPALAETNVAELAKITHFHGLAVDLGDPSRLYLATHHGLYRVRGDGAATPVTEAKDDFMGFTPHPSDASVLYASGHPRGGGNLGFVVSRDGGESWRKLSDGAGGPVDFHQMDVSRSDPNVIYGVHGGLQRSADGGRSWRRVAPAPNKLIDLAIVGTDPDTLYAATQSGLLRSGDGGRSWRSAHDARAPATMVHAADDDVIYAFLVGHGLMRAAEPARDWQLINPMAESGYLLHLAIDPTEPRKLYAVSHDPGSRRQSVIVSEDGGASWRRLGK